MKTELKVGIFVLVGLGILLYFSTRVSDGIGTSEDGVIIKARFDSVAGLVSGAEVRAAGVRIGHVVSIRLDTGLKALVEMQLRRGVEQQIPKNTRATIASLGLLGEKYVELKMPNQRDEPTEMITSGLEEGGGGGQGGGNRSDPNVPEINIQVLEQGDVIEAAPAQGIEELSGLATDIGADVKVVAAELRRAVGEGEDNRVRAILISLEKFSTSLETLVQQNQRGIDRIVGNLDQSTGVVREILSQNQKNIDATIENVRGASERIDRLLARNEEQVSELVVNLRDLTGSLKDLVAENRASLDKTVQNVESASGSLAEKLPSVLEKLDRISGRLDDLVAQNAGNVEDSVANVKSASERLDQTLDSVHSIFAKIDQGEGTVGKLINQDTVHDNLNQTMTSLQDTLGGFQKFRTYLRLRGEGLISDEPSGKGYFGVQLEPDPHKFYRIELLAEENGVEFRNHSEHTITFEGQEPVKYTVEERLFRDQLSITAAFGYRYKDLAVYAGMLEYRGGFGMEYRFLKKRGLLNFEAFDFGHPVAPHLKLTGNFFVTKNLMLTAGWDDMLDGVDSRPVFGLGLMIEDEDIRNLLGLAASGGP